MSEFLIFVLVGFAAQLVDGALGMAYGLISTTILISLGLPPAVASANVHAAEIGTTAASGLAHWHRGNVDLLLVRRLAIPGAIGGIAGALAMTAIPVAWLKPLVTLYLLGMGGLIFWRALSGRIHPRPPRHFAPLGTAAGFLDAVGGGGWGSLVTSTLIGRGAAARQAIGSTNLAEFFVTSAISATFLVTIGIEFWPIVAGLVLGGIVAAPFAATAVHYFPERPLMFAVAALILALCLRNIWQLAS
jgi:uncharacterized protein